MKWFSTICLSVLMMMFDEQIQHLHSIFIQQNCHSLTLLPKAFQASSFVPYEGNMQLHLKMFVKTNLLFQKEFFVGNHPQNTPSNIKTSQHEMQYSIKEVCNIYMKILHNISVPTYWAYNTFRSVCQEPICFSVNITVHYYNYFM